MKRLPIRLRVTLSFTLVMAVVLVATGLFLYLRLQSDLNRTIGQGLRSRASDVSALVEGADKTLAEPQGSRLTEQGASFAQVLDRRGRILDSTPLIRHRSILDAHALALARRHPLTVDTGPLPGLEESSRLLAVPVRSGGRTLVAVVGASLEDRDDALANLLKLLLIGGPVALLLASLAGYGVAAAALRPVEAMRRRAAAVSTAEPGQRLPVPPSGDEIARLGETLNAMLARIEEAFAHERAFLADASHELRTPLAILRTELELALQAGRTPQELSDAIASAAEETDRLSQLAEDLLVIARSDQGRLPIRQGEVELPELLDRLCERFAARIAGSGRRISVEPGVATVTADSLRLEQALSNLVENALRHGGGPIEIASRSAGGRCEIHVMDRGAGFPEGFLDDAFERFSRGDPARSRGGSGLGLAIVAAIATAHGGGAGAANRAGGGADVWIALPLIVSSSPAATLA